MKKFHKYFITLALFSAVAMVSQAAFGWGGSSYGSTDTSSSYDGGSSYGSTDTSSTDTSSTDTSSTDTSSSYDGGGSYGGSYGGGGFTQEFCRGCHEVFAAQEDGPFSGYLPDYNPDNHHKLIGEQIRHSTAPFQDGDGDGYKDEYYDCLNCHAFTKTPEIQRDCLKCHNVSTVTGGFSRNRHMNLRGGPSCSTCHCRMPSPGRGFGSCSDDGGWGGR